MSLRISTAVALIAVLSLGCSASEAESGPSTKTTEDLEKTWGECTADADCVAVHGICGRWVGVNKEHLTAAEAHYKRINMLVRCKQISEPDFPVACEQGRCTIKRPHDGQVRP